jgi:hypothetical protein
MENLEVHARFRIDHVTFHKHREYENGAYTNLGISGAVHLSPVRGEPFGKATPSGQIEMYVANPAALAVFQRALEAHVDGDPGEFDVVFTRRLPE